MKIKQLAPLISLSLILLNTTLNAQQKKVQDKNAIKAMCGCFEVSFNFSETFNYSDDSLYKPSKNKNDKALEWAQLVKEDKNKVSIQHLLQVGNPAKPYIVKHWRQDWLYQNTNFHMFNGNKSWLYESKTKQNVKGQWTQKVYQVDDSPRYEGSATWVHVDGKSFWENTTNSPLPRREYTKRSDYNILIRGNRHEITKNGWVHDQDNSKIIRKTDKTDVLLADEKGYNTYVRVDDSKCAAAADWWQKNKDKWSTVRNKWTEVYGRNSNLALNAKVDNKLLFKYLFSEEYSTKTDVDKIIESFIK